MVGLHRPCQAILRGLQAGLELGFPSGDLWPRCLGKWDVLGLGMAGGPHPACAHSACQGEHPIHIRDLSSPIQQSQPTLTYLLVLPEKRCLQHH